MKMHYIKKFNNDKSGATKKHHHSGEPYTRCPQLAAVMLRCLSTPQETPYLINVL